MDKRKRVLIIGLDGFTWRIGDKFIADGTMPNLASLVKDGCRGNLKSVMPFETAPAWSSFQTGCNPCNTSVWGFHRYDRKQKNIRLNSHFDIAVPSLWQLADNAGKTVVSLNMPVSSPPPKVKGVIIPGLLCPGLSEETVHPADAYEKYIKPSKDYCIVNSSYRDSVKEYVEQAKVTETARYEVASRLMKDVDWDIFSVQIQSTDAIQHRIWNAVRCEDDKRTEAEQKQACGFYRHVDDIIGKLIASAGPETLTVMASDHGFCDAMGSVSINSWLCKKGYLKMRAEKADSTWVGLKKKFKLLKLVARVYGKVKSKKDKAPQWQQILSHVREAVDIEKTSAICLSDMCGCLYINAETEKRAEIAKTITDELLKDFGPGSKRHVIAKIYPAEVVIKNEDSVPDLIIELEQGYLMNSNPLAVEMVREGKVDGTHDQQGFFVAAGKDAKQGMNLDAELIDITPTVLAYLGIAVPNHIDGKVLADGLSCEMEIKYEDFSSDKAQAVNYSDDEQAEVEKHLRDLGYL